MQNKRFNIIFKMELSVRIHEESKEDESMCDTPVRKGEDLNLTIGKVYLKDDGVKYLKKSILVDDSIPMLNISKTNLSS